MPTLHDPTQAMPVMFAEAGARTDLMCSRLYVDGVLKGQMVENVVYVNDDGETAQVTGGNPADLTGPITLCSRSDNNATRHFGGKVAYLGALSVPAHEQACNQRKRNFLFIVVPCADCCSDLERYCRSV